MQSSRADATAGGGTLYLVDVVDNTRTQEWMRTVKMFELQRFRLIFWSSGGIKISYGVRPVLFVAGPTVLPPVKTPGRSAGLTPSDFV